MRTFVTPSRPGRVSLFLLLLALAGGDPRSSLALGAVPVPPEDAAPIAAAAGIVSAYQRMDVRRLASLMTEDFHFVSDDPDQPELASPGFSRQDELAAASHLFNGVERPGVGRLPAARSITVNVASWSLESRSGPPGQPPLAGVVVARGVTLVVTFEHGPSIAAGPACHVFAVVRGDVAALPGGGHGDPARYYVRRWAECNGPACQGQLAAAGEPDSGAGPRPSPDSGAVAGLPRRILGRDGPAAREELPPTALALAPVTNPARGELAVELALPGTEPARCEVVDVTGRRLRVTEVSGAGPRRARIALDPRRELPPGVYWLRLSQGRRLATRRVVVLR